MSVHKIEVIPGIPVPKGREGDKRFGEKEGKAEKTGNKVNGEKRWKKGVDKYAGVWYNHQRCRERSERAERHDGKRSLKTIQRKVILNKEDAERRRVRGCIEQSDSERVKRLDEMKEANRLWRAGWRRAERWG